MKKTGIVTGGSRGIGLAIAKQLGVDGYNIVIVATKAETYYKEQLKWFKEHKIDYLYIQGDIRKKEDRQAILDGTVAQFGAIHILINNAGIAPSERRDLLEMTEESYDKIMDINMKGTLFLSQLIAKQMMHQVTVGKQGTIINITSISSEVSSINRGEYCLSKAGVSMLTTLFADRLAGEGILVHEVRPGIIKTTMTEGVQEKYDALIEEGVFPISRWGKPEDVANMVGLLCSDQVTYATGNHWYVDGGFHIKRL